MSRLMIRLTALAPGSYAYGQYRVERLGRTDWRWSDTKNPHRGGEWRASKREAPLDQMAHLAQN